MRSPRGHFFALIHISFADRDSIKDQRHRNLVTLDFKRLQNSQEQVVADIGNDHGKIAELDQHKIIVHWERFPGN